MEYLNKYYQVSIDHTKPFKGDNGVLFEEGKVGDWDTDA